MCSNCQLAACTCGIIIGAATTTSSSAVFGTASSVWGSTAHNHKYELWYDDTMNMVITAYDRQAGKTYKVINDKYDFTKIEYDDAIKLDDEYWHILDLIEHVLEGNSTNIGRHVRLSQEVAHRVHVAYMTLKVMPTTYQFAGMTNKEIFSRMLEE